MAVSIRLRRMGRKKQPHYRVVVAGSEFARDGRFVESLGYYKPLTHPARLVLDLERVDYWIGQGAQPSGTVKSLISKARKGGDQALVVGEQDVTAEKAKRAEMLAERRAGEKRKEAAAAAPKKGEGTPTVVPQDIAEVDDVPAASKPKAGSVGEEDGSPEAVATPTEAETPALEASTEAQPAKKAKKARKDAGAE